MTENARRVITFAVFAVGIVLCLLGWMSLAYSPMIGTIFLFFSCLLPLPSEYCGVLEDDNNLDSGTFQAALIIFKCFDILKCQDSQVWRVNTVIPRTGR